MSDGAACLAAIGIILAGLIIGAASIGVLLLIALGCLVFAAIVWITWEASS